jgi:hypothetical protein
MPLSTSPERVLDRQSDLVLAEPDPHPLRHQRGARRGLEDAWATAAPIGSSVAA